MIRPSFNLLGLLLISNRLLLVALEEHGFILHVLGLLQHILSLISILDESGSLIDLDLPDVLLSDLLCLRLLL